VSVFTRCSFSRYVVLGFPLSVTMKNNIANKCIKPFDFDILSAFNGGNRKQ